MPDKVRQIYESADMIANGYAFTKGNDGFISILNLEHPDCAMVINTEGEIIETNMDQIEQRLAVDLFQRNLQFMEV